MTKKISFQGKDGAYSHLAIQGMDAKPSDFLNTFEKTIKINRDRRS